MKASNFAFTVNMILKYILLIFVFFNLCGVVFLLKCRSPKDGNQAAQDVDWWFIYKLPKIKDGNVVVVDGLQYYYYDSEMEKAGIDNPV